MALLNNADEPELAVPDAHIQSRRHELEQAISDRESALAKAFPGGEETLARSLSAWEKAQAKRLARWEILRPTSAVGSLPLLSVLADQSVRASGDMSKRDTYDLGFEADLRGVSAIRLEVLPDDGLPKRGPGRVYYEGPAGDFFLSEVKVQADGRPVKLVRASHSYAKKGFGAERAHGR